MRVFLFVMMIFISPAYAIEVRYAEDMCRLLSAYKGGEGTEFIPGVDVRGRKVATADLPDGITILGDNDDKNIRIPLNVDLAERFNITRFEDDFLESKIATLRVTKDGEVYFNERNLTTRANVICSGGE